ncbi:MAG: NADH-quinone oxidoreductase subunit N [Bacteroidales bacterium]|nr:NADH-quinone oxidoreductase subunit N [Bacteroidales bacterium]HOA10008.1 NADH-quinone oxidoreductase subunit N [Tenuifilaceae bacterium]MBP8643862.1 NADH-quinone oxidoreductase subunit N [Bacteroidales bacterium]NLI87232.1 NADH-quinone oxidoreductase subunit N [Bacteroidales bacterium]HOG72409.1 NADH-quinone oxidoreductase subunit N [Tenuifilaceae bacterium]
MLLQYLSLMRQEVSLIFIAVLVLICELTVNQRYKKVVIPITLVLFGVHTILGFVPFDGGKLFGGMFATSHAQALMKSVLNVGVFIILLQSVAWLKKEVNFQKSNEFLILLFSTLTGMYFMISSGDFLMFYIGLEIASIPMAMLAAFDTFRSKSSEAGIKFLLNSALSSGILLFGISLFYAISGTIYFDDLPLYFSPVSPLFALGFIFFISGLAFKMSLVPFHLWTADVYEGSPTIVTSYFSVISKGAAAFITSILLFKVFFNQLYLWKDIIYLLSVLTMTVGNLFALRQTNIKRFLAFSSISQAGFILLGLVNVDSLGVTAIIYFILIYILSNLSAFGVVMAIANVTGKEEIKDYNGLYKTNPLLSLTMMLAMFSLAGIPPTAGFFSKFFLFTDAAKGGYYWLVFIAVLNTIISLYYYLLVVKAMFISPNEQPIERFRSDIYTRTALLITVVGIFAVGIYSPIFEYIRNIIDKF